MARKKSKKDLVEQIIRINSATAGRNTLRRREQALKIFNRYKDNIQNSPSYKRTVSKGGLDALVKAHNRKYSQRTYMGNAIG